MLSRTVSRFVPALLALAFGWTATSQAAVKDRIAGGITAGSRIALANTVSPRALQAADGGAAPTSQKLDGLTVRFSMTAEQQAALSQLLVDQQNASSPRYRQWLTPQQFGAEFGLSAGDLAKVTSWLTSQGFTVTGVANSSTFVTFTGTVGQVQQAFGTTVHTLSLNGEQHIANLSELKLPSELSGVVSAVSGISDFKLKPRNRFRQVIAASSNATLPRDTINTQNGLEHFLSPGDFYTIYDLNPLINGSPAINGTGVSIAVMGQVDITLADVAAFRSASSLSANVPNVVTYGTDPGAPSANCNSSAIFCPTTSDLQESLLDVEWSGATAPSAKITFVNSTDVIGTSLVQAIDNNLASIMTVSYGGCEVQDFPISTLNALNTTFQQANAQGITVLGPSGDSGATDCDDTGVRTATHGLAVDFPASSPNVTAVGGTEFSEGPDNSTTQPGTYWNNSGSAVSSALSYIPEGVWNDTTALLAASSTSTLSAAGGGVSAVFTKPVWQVGSGVPADGFRDLPDISFSASAEHDAYLVCAQGSCMGGTQPFISANGSFNAFGGTSVATPAFAGIMALVEQKLGGARIGNANPYIYALANGSSASTIFHDVTTGNNNSPCTAGSPGCTGTSIGYSAGPGYDLASGWGSLDVAKFAQGLTAAGLTLRAATSTTLVASPSNPALNQSLTFTATVAANSGSSVPTGTMLFTVDGAATGTTVPLNSGGVATFTGSFNSTGAHSVVAFYSGDTTFYGSSATTALTVGPIPTGTISLTSANISVARGGSGTSAITVTSAGGYAGTVNLTVTSADSRLGGTYSFTPSAAVVLAAGGMGTATFSITSVTGSLRQGGGSLKKNGGGTIAALLGGGVTLAGLIFCGFSGRRRKGWGALLSVVAIGALAAGMGCSSSSNTGGGTTTTPTGTGPYAVTVTGTDSVTSSIVATTTFSITIN